MKMRRHSKLVSWAFSWTVLAALSVNLASAAPFSEMVVFGDSLSDRRNIHGMAFTVAPRPPYADGRFSNGPLWIERLSSRLGLGNITASRDGGGCFAWGGVKSGEGVTVFNPGDLFEFSGPNVGKQVTDWTAAHEATSSQLFTMLVGGNDLLGILGNSDADQESAAAQEIADNISTSIQRLYDDGARHVLIANLPDLGKSPRYRDTNRTTRATGLTIAFNEALHRNLNRLESTHADLNLYRLDLFGLFNKVFAEPRAYGFTNVTDRAYTGDDGFRGTGRVVPNPAEYVFWDLDHPTTAAHVVIGDAAFAALPKVTAVLSGDPPPAPAGTCPATPDDESVR